MKELYDRCETRYICKRCNTPISVESDTFHWFSGTEDPCFWCPTCEDFPCAKIIGTPAENLPTQLQLPKDFICRIVPSAEPSDVEQWNLLYRPYSKRSFLRQYVEWLRLDGVETCDVQSSATVSAKFDQGKQQYTKEVIYEVSDTCSSKPCQFLQLQSLKPIKPDEIECFTIKFLCDIKGKYGLCQTTDEAMILRWYLTVTGGQHYPMLIPQASILKGKKRPDFMCFVPRGKFQYEKVVVLVDRPGKDVRIVLDENREYQQAGFLVKRLEIHPESKSYFKVARELATWVENLPIRTFEPPPF